MVAIEPPARYVFFDGAIVPWADARVHVFSPAVKYGAGVFEGIRGYWNDDHQQMYVFRLAEHMQRLHYSQLMMRFDRIIDVDHVAEQILELVRANHHRETLHIRPNVFVAGYGESGARTPVSLAITAVPRPLPQRVESGCSVQVSAWQRVPDRAMPMQVKANANYNNAPFAAVQAQLDGYETALFLNDRGKVSEGPGMCFFMIRDGVPVTPSITSDILESITRDTVLTLSRERLGVEPVERDIDRSELFAADEAFFCGTGWEITPVTSIDRLPVGAGEVGPLTRALQRIYFDIVHARVDNYPHWRTAVYP